jgi:hypothetical protein
MAVDPTLMFVMKCACYVSLLSTFLLMNYLFVMCKRHKVPVRDTIIIHVVIFSVLENYFVSCVFYFLLYCYYFNVSLTAENNSYTI